MKIPLILLHGALGSTAHWDELTKLLEPQFDVRSFNFAGHGGKACQEEFSMDMFAHDLGRFMELNQISKADIFGYSMGGYVALKYALDHSQQIGKIMTLGTKFNWTPESAAKEISMLDPVEIMKKVPHFGEALRVRHNPLDWKEVVTKTANLMYNLAHGEAIDFSTTQIPNEIQISVGDLDRVVKFGEAIKVAEGLPNATFVPLPGVKHPIEQVDKNMLAQQMVKFFN